MKENLVFLFVILLLFAVIALGIGAGGQAVCLQVANNFEMRGRYRLLGGGCYLIDTNGVQTPLDVYLSDFIVEK